MVIYQVIDERNRIISEFQSAESAELHVEDLALWFEHHHFHIEALQAEQSYQH